MRRSLPLLLLGLVWVACGPAPETVKPPASPVSTKEGLYGLGHQFMTENNYDSAEVYLKAASAMDASYLAPLNELAQMHYALGIRQPGEKNPKRLEHFRKSFSCFVKLESQGSSDSELYERLSELSNALNDDKALVKYSKKNAEIYPYERQYFNLGFAHFQVGDYQNVVKTQREAIAKFNGSTFIGSFYRQLGLKAVDGVIADQTKASGNFASTEEYRRLIDDKIGMLISLKSLHQTYRTNDKLQKVDQQLKELGYSK
jgi:tetratricopeptide (TPR) repeat protein